MTTEATNKNRWATAIPVIRAMNFNRLEAAYGTVLATAYVAKDSGLIQHLTAMMCTLASDRFLTTTPLDLAHEVGGFQNALKTLLSESAVRERMGRVADHATLAVRAMGLDVALHWSVDPEKGLINLVAVHEVVTTLDAFTRTPLN